MIDMIFGIIGTLLYPLFSIIFLFISAIQNIFYAFAGIGNITFGGQPVTSGNSGDVNDNGLVFYMLERPLVKNMLLSIMFLAMFLVIIFTVMAFIKNAYAAKQKGWKEIIGNSIKGLANFIFIPLCCLLGIWLSNILLQAVNGATSNGGSSEMSRKLFIAAAYNANVFRDGVDANATADADKVALLKTTIDGINFTADIVEFFGGDFARIQNLEEGQNNEYYAIVVDQLFSVSIPFVTDIGNPIFVAPWYKLYAINYLTIIVGGIFMLYVLCALAFAMVRRMFLIIILYIISPGMCAMYPLDEGKAVGSWKSEFIKQVLSVYGAVAGINIFFSIMPLIDKIEMYGGVGEFAGVNNIIQIFILVVGLLCVKELTGMISGFVGGEDALGKGTSLMKESKEKVVRGAKTASRFAGAAAPYAKAVGSSLFNIGKAGAQKVGGAVSGAVDKAKAKHHENKVNRLAKKEGLSHEEAEKKIKYAPMQRQIDKQNKRYQVGEDGEMSAKGQKRYNKDLEKTEKSIARQDKRQANQAERAQEKAERKAWNEGREQRLKDGTATFGDVVKNEASKLPGGIVSLASTIASATGMTKFKDEVVDEYRKSYGGVGSRDKARAAGPFGTKKAAKNMGSVMKDKDGNEKDFDATSVVNAGGVSGQAALNLVLDNAKITINGKTIAQATGLDVKSPAAQEDLSYFDQVINKLQNHANNINNASSHEVRGEYLKAAIKYASEVDTQGNDVLQQAVQEMMSQYVEAQTKNNADLKSKQEGMSVSLDGEPIRLEQTSIRELAEASKSIGREVANAVNKNVSSVIAEIRKINAKKDK